MYLVDASLKCNFNCAYCYNQELRREGALKEPDLPAIKRAIQHLFSTLGKGSICLHGGEPLSWGHAVVEELLALSYELTGASSIQTNGSLIDSQYISMFKRYKTSVGLSLDGFGELNSLRCDLETTERVVRNLEWLISEGISVGLITVLHRINAGTEARLRELEVFLAWCGERKLSGRLNPVLWEDPRAMSAEELVPVYLRLAEFLGRQGLATSWSPFRDILASLKGEKEVVCIFRPCWPYHTPAGITITESGEFSTCCKFAKHRLENTLRMSDLRQRVLAQTECKGCPYFGWACFGGCPASAKDFDWRRKDRFCPVWKSLFSYYERKLKELGIQVARRACEGLSTTPGPAHWDGVEHTDGGFRHLDSDAQVRTPGHTDGVEHTDGAWRHLDSGPGR